MMENDDNNDSDDMNYQQTTRVYGSKHIRNPPIYDGISSWKDYRVQFELIAEMNGWNSPSMALELAASLRGPAQAVLTDLEPHERKNYTLLSTALRDRFQPENQTALYRVQLKNRMR